MATTNRGLSGNTSSIGPASLDLRPATADPTAQPSPTFSDTPSPRSATGPLPLPSFVFPAKAPSSAPSSFSRGSARRPVSAIEVRGGFDKMGERDKLHTPELPAFTFGGSPTSPPASPPSRNIPSRPGSHQRGASEFIGGDGASGTSTVPMSTSPTKGDGPLPQPTGFGPPGGRRGHRHVRSAAISYHDITMILKPPTSPTTTRGSSAPTSPAGDHEAQQSGFPGSMDAALQTGVEGSGSAHNPDPPRDPLRALNRARVGFSDNVEVIPRPLSLVSSDSSSTVTGRQGGHSVSNSISSIISSAGAASPPSKDKRGTLSPSWKYVDSRPRTAEPVLDRERVEHPEEPKRRNSIPLLMEAALASPSAQSTPRSAKKWTFFGHDSNSGECSPNSRPTSAGSGGKESKLVHDETFNDEADHTAVDEPLPSIEPTSSRKSSISRKQSKKQKKVRSWAGSILSRKTRQRSQTKQKMSRRSPTPPHRSYPPIDDTSKCEAQQPEPQTRVAEPDNDIASWKPRRLPPQDDSMSPMIDLDAALGPFNTPSSFGDDWENSQKTGPRKRAMHSAAGLGGFAGPGMHYHRRAESAPEFENPRFGLHRLGSSSTMAMEDVFEEDEDEWEDAKASSDKEDTINPAEEDISTGLGININIEDTEESQSEQAMSLGMDDVMKREIKRMGSSLSEGDRRTVGTAKSEHSATSLMDEPITEESPGAIKILDDSTSSRPDSRARSSDSTATPPFRPRTGKELAPVDIQPFSLQPPYLTPTSPRSTIQSSLPSPRSPFSYDPQRISTAPSSVTDEHGFQSLLFGEPGPELRYSVDDVPSLTSSNSTMTRESGHPGTGNPQFRDGQRSASLSSAAVTRKRSSMASLSRLISSSHGEKSKLSVESRPPGTAESEKKDKSSKNKRISRLMQFWKPKDAPA